MGAKIIVVGSLNIDLVTRTAHLPQPGETIIGSDLQTIPGGKGANQAVAAARVGAEVAMIGRVGNDLFAEQLRVNLTANHVNTEYVMATESASGVALIVVDASGQNSIVVSPGANGLVTAVDIQNATPIIKSADLILLQLEIPLNAVQKAASIAHEHGVKVILNPAPAQPLPPELLQLVDILIPNESETSLLTGLSVNTQTEVEIAACQLLKLGVETVVLTLGERGALLANATGMNYISSFSVNSVVDTTAAGDSFVGGFAMALAEGKPLIDAVRWGNAAGAIAVTRVGAQPSLPTRAEVEKIIYE
ncbi:MAG: ribokinase [Chloroflexi bacterium]|nr:ribokinase [Chloroflexota bacterium]